MNGEVMDESIKTPEQSKNDISRHLQLSEEEGFDAKEEQTIPGPEKEPTAGERSDIISEVDTKSIPVTEKNSPDPSISERKECSSREICDRNVENREVHVHVQGLEGLCQEGAPQAPPTSTNGLEKSGNSKRSNIKGSPEPESELENSNTFPEKMNNNSKDSSMLSTTDTQDEVDTIDYGDQIFMNHVDNQTEASSKTINDNDRAKQQVCSKQE